MQKNSIQHISWLALAAAACLQWPLLRLLGAQVPASLVPFFSGVSILGAAFLLSWAGEAAELDIPQGLAVAALAIVAVLPEYAVDVYFAWRAGREPAYTAFATANMTGSNRLLIGLGWAAVLAASWKGTGRREIRLDDSLAIEMTALAAATLYAFAIPIKRTLSLLDCGVFFLIFAVYASRLGRSPHEAVELEGPATLLGELPQTPRRLSVLLLFAVAATGIYLAAAPFADGLIDTGRRLGIDQFLLVQWVAPLASEAPEFLVAVVFALRGRAKAGLRMLVSAKVSQWTLLIGMLPAAYALSARSGAPMPLDSHQAHEILLTAAQSFFGLAVLLDLRFSWKEAAALAALFVPQPFFTSALARDIFSAIYLIGGAALFRRNGGWSRAAQLGRNAFT